MCGEARAVRAGKSAESSTIQLTEEDYLVAVRPLGRGGEPPVEPGGTGAWLLEERALLEELWRISHFGWISEAVICRALTLSGGREVPTDCLHRSLRRLLERGWVEYEGSERDDGEPCWRLSDSGRQIRVSETGMSPITLAAGERESGVMSQTHVAHGPRFTAAGLGADSRVLVRCREYGRWWASAIAIGMRCGQRLLSWCRTRGRLSRGSSAPSAMSSADTRRRPGR